MRAVVSDLAGLMRAAKIREPYVLVGHSIGGLYARAYDEQHHRQVAGMVLVDSSQRNRFGVSPRANLEPYPSTLTGRTGSSSAQKASFHRVDGFNGHQQVTCRYRAWDTTRTCLACDATGSSEPVSSKPVCDRNQQQPLHPENPATNSDRGNQRRSPRCQQADFR